MVRNVSGASRRIKYWAKLKSYQDIDYVLFGPVP